MIKFKIKMFLKSKPINYVYRGRRVPIKDWHIRKS